MSKTGRTPTQAKAEKSSLTDRTLNRLRKDIITGKIAPGTIVRDAELAAAYGVSTSPIREALTLLETEHLVLKPSNKVRQVAPIDRKLTADISAVLTVLVEFAVELGIEKLDMADLGQLQLQCTAMKGALSAGDGQLAKKSADRFFRVIINACDNPALQKAIANHASWIDRLFTLSIPMEFSGWYDAVEGVNAHLQNGDKPGAIACLKACHRIFLDVAGKIYTSEWRR